MPFRPRRSRTGSNMDSNPVTREGADMHGNRKLSRRSALKSAVVLAGAACSGLLLSEQAYAQKASKAAMKYQDHPDGDKKCSGCMQFEPPNSCKVVDGTISPNGYCIAWVKKA